MKNTRKFNLGLVVSVVMLVMAATAFASVIQFAGVWKNINPNTNGVTTLDIKVSGTNMTVRTWGKCSPTDCDWGTVTAYPYAKNVSVNLANTARVVSAIYTTGFSETIIIIRPMGKARLRAETFTRFTDGSGRSNYNAAYIFKK
jgi:hypothetical protein